MYHQFNKIQVKDVTQVSITVDAGESVASLAKKLEDEGIIKSAGWFTRYLQLKGVDKKIHAGNFSITGPITFDRIVSALIQQTTKEEREVTILPGWDNRDIAAYLSAEGYGTEEDIYALIGYSAVDYRRTPQETLDVSNYAISSAIPEGASLEGYLAPDTYRVFADADAATIIEKLFAERDAQISPELLADIKASGRSMHDIIIVASLLEREVRGAEAKKIVADIFWRRLDNGWGMQADSTVHYLTNTSGNVFTSAADRDTDSPYNTYKYPGLPLGPISNPSLMAIEAAINPTPNDYWYFLTTLDTGEAKYGRTLDEHNANVQTYLR